MDVKVSVCLPVYGVEKYIEKCARSLFKQTMRDGLEFVFVNDCTPDKSIEILEQVLSEYPHRKEQTKIINLPENGGVGRARYVAIENCTGEYIIHCDPDDWVELDMYEKMYNAAKENDADMVYCDYTSESSTGTSLYVTDGQALTADGLLSEFFARKASWVLWNKMYKRPLAQIDEALSYLNKFSCFSEDCFYNITMLKYCKNIKKASFPLYHHASRQNSLVAAPTSHARKVLIEVILLIDKEYSSAATLNPRRREALYHAIAIDYFDKVQWHEMWKKAKKDMWKDKNFSIKAKCIFYLACINYPLASWIYRKIKGIKE